MSGLSIVREFIAVYGQEAFERLAVRSDSDATLAAACARALDGPKKECTNVAQKLEKIVVRWTIEPSKPNGASCTYFVADLGEELARLRAASRSSIIRANGGNPTATLYYDNGLEEVKEFALKV